MLISMADTAPRHEETTTSADSSEGVSISDAARRVDVAHAKGIQLGDGNVQHNTYIQTAATVARAKGHRRYLWGALAVTIMLFLGAFCYHEWWAPGTTNQSSDQAMVNGTDVQVFPPYDQPDGKQSYEYPVVNSDMPVTLKCYVSLPDGLWYQIYDNGGWIPRDAVHAIPGTAFPNPPHC
jgi:hypothetical protein